MHLQNASGDGLALHRHVLDRAAALLFALDELSAQSTARLRRRRLDLRRLNKNHYKKLAVPVAFFNIRRPKIGNDADVFHIFLHYFEGFYGIRVLSRSVSAN